MEAGVESPGLCGHSTTIRTSIATPIIQCSGLKTWLSGSAQTGRDDASGAKTTGAAGRFVGAQVHMCVCVFGGQIGRWRAEEAICEQRSQSQQQI
jgi:hypothetical protein